MTFSEYLAYKPPPGFRDELIHGEIVLSPSANRKHSDLCLTLYDALKNRIGPAYVARLDTTHRLGEREGPRPDVFVIGKTRWIAAGDGYPEGSPELAIEVLSPSNDKKERETKRDLYLSDPRCLAVWEVSPASLIVTCFRRGIPTTYGLHDRIPLPELVGEATISVNEIFAGVLS